MIKLILASSSPRRREILENLNLDFEVIVSAVEEIVDEFCPPEKAVQDLAKLKARDVFQNNPDATVLAADTVVAFGNRILGKPVDEKDAFEMLKMLSGKTHDVYTGFCVIDAQRTVLDYDKTSVKFFEISDSDIRRYIKTNEPMDKAGAYGIQGMGAMFVEKIEGDYFNVVGLPVLKVCQTLCRDFGFEAFHIT